LEDIDRDLWFNNRGQPGDKLFLTKKIGTGILSTALKRGVLKPETNEEDAEVQKQLYENMTTINRVPAEAAMRLGKEGKIQVRGCTDITGFGFLGHLLEMLTPIRKEEEKREVERFLKLKEGEKYQQVKAKIYVDRIPLLPRTREYCAQDLLPGGTRKNSVRFTPKLKQHEESLYDVQTADIQILADAMTSGGLLFAISNRSEMSVEELEKELGAVFVGELEAKDENAAECVELVKEVA
jgi:selenide,water dikinase